MIKNPLTRLKKIVEGFFKFVFEKKRDFKQIYRAEKIGNSTNETLLTPMRVLEEPREGNFFTEIVEASKNIEATIHPNLKEIFLENTRLDILKKMQLNTSCDDVLLFSEGEAK